MTVLERLRALAAALPSDSSAVTLTRADLEAMLRDADTPPPRTKDLTVAEVADETNRAPSTVRGWLIAGELRGYRFNRREWRVPRPALKMYLDAQRAGAGNDLNPAAVDADLSAWRANRGVR